MKDDHGQIKGSMGEHLASAAFLYNGYQVYQQDNESGAADLLIEKNGKIQRIQVKAFYNKTFGKNSGRNPQTLACLERSGYSKSRTPVMRDIRDQVDYFAIVDTETAEVFLLPSEEANKSSINKNSVKGKRIYPK